MDDTTVQGEKDMRNLNKLTFNVLNLKSVFWIQAAGIIHLCRLMKKVLLSKRQLCLMMIYPGLNTALKKAVKEADNL